MDGDPQQQALELPWRVGTKVGRTIYAVTDLDLDGHLIGVMDTPDLAARAVADHNRMLDEAKETNGP